MNKEEQTYDAFQASHNEFHVKFEPYEQKAELNVLCDAYVETKPLINCKVKTKAWLTSKDYDTHESKR